MITKIHYFGSKSYPVQHGENADLLLSAVNALLHEAAEAGVYDYEFDPDTGTQISGAKGGSGDGGYRTKDSKTGATHSTHKEGNGIDVNDPLRKLAKWIKYNKKVLDKYDLYCEMFEWTPVWCHFQRVPPGSGMRIYRPSMAAPLAPEL